MSAPTAFWFVLSALFFYSHAHAGEVTLGWDYSGPSQFRVYYGAASRFYTNSFVTGPVTQCTVTGLADGATYYFAVTALGTNGEESDYSNEAAYTVSPGTAPAPVLALRDPNGFTITTGTNAAPDSAHAAAFTVWTATNLPGPWTPAATIYAPAASQMFFKTSLTPPK